MQQVDLIIRGGTIVDGGGGEPYVGDVAIDGGVIVAIGSVTAAGREEIDASGAIVTPGFVDIHTHYDAQATWANRLNPSSHHGVTTVVIGNCGVGFAPCRAEDRDALIHLMEGVEDIPGVVLNEGIPWRWETFPEFLDFLGGRAFDMDVAAYVPHAPLRLYVMGERALGMEPATAEDIARMRALANAAIEAGAVGFATSRSIHHRSSDGAITYSYAARRAELSGIVSGLADAGRGVFQMISDFDDPEAEFAMARGVIEQTRRPMTFSLMQLDGSPDRWRTLLDQAEAAVADGLEVTAQVAGRPVGVLLGLELSTHPFTYCPSYRPIAERPHAERLAAMRDPALRARLVAEYPNLEPPMLQRTLTHPERMFRLNSAEDYEPDLSHNLAAQAEKRGVSAAEQIYDVLLEDEGRSLIYVPAANFTDGTPDVMATMLQSQVTVPGLGDGGAHCSFVCDASLPTYLLKRWTFSRGTRLSVPGIVKALTSDSARAVGLHDRGQLKVGLRGDVNVIDLERLALHRPHIVHDLPKGGSRLDQHAEGYVATVVAGEVTYRGGDWTGALPGRLVRSGAQASSD